MGFLEEICRERKAAINAIKRRTTPRELEESRLWDAPRRELAQALTRKLQEPVRFLAEIKRASPSAGPIRPEADPVEIAKEYTDAGASALSILTEPTHFDGDPAFLGKVREAAPCPLLMKDFFLDEWQVAWARSLGADAILVIVAAVDRILLRDLIAAARDLGLEALVEIHTTEDLDRALALTPNLIGINHRDLGTLQVDLSLTERILPLLPAGVTTIAESGIRTREDVVRLEALGVDALLVGESLMRARSPGAALRALRADGRTEG
jgi:indole-3-glycerol phosphate synthase